MSILKFHYLLIRLNIWSEHGHGLEYIVETVEATKLWSENKYNLECIAQNKPLGPSNKK